MFENKAEKLLPWPRFVRRLIRCGLLAAGIVALALAIGIAGYHGLGRLEWIDALLNASMILTGMGPVDPMKSDGAKLFASAYALFSGVIFLSAIGVVLAPIYHRFIHNFHLDKS
ncbi:MAG TPA: hypothetical protein VGF85_07500 [Opitutaceae bacterium]|jgi:hypothetical protein